ncbi:MAG: cysteine rich repeat-containing protein [Pseudomonadota bacterium]
MSIVTSHRHHPKFVPLGCLLGGAIAAFAAGLAPVMAQTKIPEAMRNQAMSLAQTCGADRNRLCPNVQPGGGRILACLNANAASLSEPCRAALPDAASLASRAAGAGAMPK